MQILATSFVFLITWNKLLVITSPCIQDLSGRPHLSCGLDIPTQRVGTYDTQVICEICKPFVIYQTYVQLI